ncbi:zinc/iron permease [Thermocrinis albus DSM 14484]|uniref:Zinc/iron permease n=1 Tax=Thermocrinis albus (strain DSM 14484 / JCM 11386 / HI 11/12) TaxID=638303 RepID=D3SMX4_THEAH|nr:ZIP family metal transporter [Thermocrinis albus]ADC90104.1 zinc/iron permease [Thermocrinis albus DSM 14484]
MDREILFILALLTGGTTLGSLLAVPLGRFTDMTFSLAFAGGVMLVASFTSLILPALHVGTFLHVTLGICSGFLVMMMIERTVPHQHVVKGQEGIGVRTKKIYLMVLGVLIHNLPEGFSVGVSTSYSLKDGTVMAIAIALQDIPEGMVVTMPLVVLTGGILSPMLVGVVSGLAESLFFLLGLYVMESWHGVLPWGLAFGGGAMLYVTVKEVFPEAYASGRDTIATLGFLLGSLVMLWLDSFQF